MDWKLQHCPFNTFHIIAQQNCYQTQSSPQPSFCIPSELSNLRGICSILGAIFAAFVRPFLHFCHSVILIGCCIIGSGRILFMSSINNVADAIGKSTKELCKVMEGSRARVYSEEEIYKELEIMGITSEDEIFNAYLFLVERPEKARALFGCPLNKRVSMLGRMMGARE